MSYVLLLEEEEMKIFYSTISTKTVSTTELVYLNLTDYTSGFSVWGAVIEWYHFCRHFNCGRIAGKTDFT